MKQRALALLLAAASTACGADWEFDRVVKAVENFYGVKQTHIPLMGVANFVVKVAHPAGASGFKIAVFEDLPSALNDEGQRALDRLMRDVTSRGLQPLVVTRSRRNSESTYLLAGEIGKSTRLLIATFERHEATVVEVRVDMHKLLQLIGFPDEVHKLTRTGQDDRDDR
jgi:hypothetical protein